MSPIAKAAQRQGQVTAAVPSGILAEEGDQASLLAVSAKMANRQG